MKKILITLIGLLLTFSNVYALENANPMPNLVRHVMANANLLHLTNTQKQEVKKWARDNKPKVLRLVRELKIQENKVLKDSLSNDDDILSKAESTLDIRREIIQIKTLCRTHLKDLLSEKQYSQLLDIYKEAQYQDSQIIL